MLEVREKYVGSEREIYWKREKYEIEEQNDIRIRICIIQCIEERMQRVNRRPFFKLVKIIIILRFFLNLIVIIIQLLIVDNRSKNELWL